MRNAFAKELTEIAAERGDVVMLSADIGNKLFDPFKERFPDRFFNCGVAEANMISVAAGMAMEGLRPFAYTITSFLVTKTIEQIRVDVCYHGAPVIIVGVGAGLAYAANGATHHSCEEISFMRVLPKMTVLCPGDAWEVREAVRAALRHDGPVYIRIGKKGEPAVHTTRPEFEIGRAIPISEGRDVTLLATGTILPVAIAAAEVMKTRGISAGVVSFHTVKPLDTRLLIELFSRCSVVATVEEHSVHGGLGGAVAEWLADQEPMKAALCRIGTADEFLHEAGGQDYARRRFGLTPEGIASRVAARFEKRQRA